MLSSQNTKFRQGGAAPCRDATFPVKIGIPIFSHKFRKFPFFSNLKKKNKQTLQSTCEMICNLISSPKLALMGFKRLKSMSFGGLHPLDPHQGPLNGPCTPHHDGRVLRSLRLLHFAAISFFFSTTKWHLCPCNPQIM